MQAMALIEMLRENERTFGEEGQKAAYRALRKTGYDVGHQILEGTTIPETMTDAEFVSFFATVINRIAYASLEDPKIDNDGQASFHIRWCPHQDHYEAFDCRVQRYFVQGMIDAARDHANRFGFEVRFDSTIPAGAETCHFTMWQATDEEREQWALLTQKLERKALRVIQED
jgi:hypothetical protein